MMRMLFVRYFGPVASVMMARRKMDIATKDALKRRGLHEELDQASVRVICTSLNWNRTPRIDSARSTKGAVK